MEVVPIPPNDQRKPVDRIRTRTFFILNDRLDEDILRNALDRLIRQHWRKLGARVVSRPDGSLEYHIADTFEEEYVLFIWSSKEYDHSIDTLPSFPKATPAEKGATLLPSLSSIEKYLRPEDWPLERKDEPPNAPLLYIHLSSFTDSTVIGVSLPHVASDQFGLANIMKAWLGVAKGEAPPPLVGYDKDILANGKAYKDYPKKEVVRKGRMRVRRRFEYPFVIMGFIPELIIHSKEIAHTLFLPLPLVASLRERCAKELMDKYSKDPGITNGDIITGLALKLSQMHKKYRLRKTAVTQTINLRNRIPQLQGLDGDAFIHNSLHYATFHVQLKSTTPLSEIAYLNRQAIIQALDPKDIEIANVVNEEMVRRGQGTHICEPFENSLNISNWSAGWKGLDFSQVVRKPEEGGKKKDELKLLVLGYGGLEGSPNRFNNFVFCKTEEGYWCSLSLPVKTIRLIEEHLKKDPMLENL